MKPKQLRMTPLITDDPYLLGFYTGSFHEIFKVFEAIQEVYPKELKRLVKMVEKNKTLSEEELRAEFAVEVEKAGALRQPRTFLIPQQQYYEDASPAHRVRNLTALRWMNKFRGMASPGVYYYLLFLLDKWEDDPKQRGTIISFHDSMKGADKTALSHRRPRPYYPDKEDTKNYLKYIKEYAMERDMEYLRSRAGIASLEAIENKRKTIKTGSQIDIAYKMFVAKHIGKATYSAISMDLAEFWPVEADGGVGEHGVRSRVQKVMHAIGVVDQKKYVEIYEAWMSDYIPDDTW